MRWNDEALASAATGRGLQLRIKELMNCGLGGSEALELSLLVEADAQRAGQLLRLGREPGVQADWRLGPHATPAIPTGG